MTSVEQSIEHGPTLGADGVARLDVLLRQNELEWKIRALKIDKLAFRKR